MNNRLIKISLILVVVFIFAISCKTTEFGYDVIDVNGMIYDFTNRPVPNCEVSLGSRFTCMTDINGRFTLSRIPAGTYIISGQKAGFETYSEEITIRDRGQIIYFRIPSRLQLLNLADEALTANNLDLAGEMAGRAYLIDNKNAETVLYYAAVKFRQHEYRNALMILENAQEAGIRDTYIDKFINGLKEIANENPSE